LKDIKDILANLKLEINNRIEEKRTEIANWNEKWESFG